MQGMGWNNWSVTRENGDKMMGNEHCLNGWVLKDYITEILLIPFFTLSHGDLIKVKLK